MDYYQLLSITGSFFVCLLVLLKPRSLVTLVALVIMLFLLFGQWALVGIIAAGAIRIVIPTSRKQIKG